MKNLLKNKIVIISFLFIVLTFSININSYANTSVNIDGVVVTNFSLPEYEGDEDSYIAFFSNGFNICFYNSDKYHLLYREERSDIWLAKNDTEEIFSESVFRRIKYTYDVEEIEGQVFYTLRNNPTISKAYCEVVNVVLPSDNPNFLSNRPVFTADGTEVFHPAPQGMVEPMKIQQVEEIPEKAVEIVKMIIPVCLIIFGTLLVLYLIKSKNLLQL